MKRETIRLTQLSHGGGCGCKIAPAVLDKLIGKLPRRHTEPALLVGMETHDDAAVYRLNGRQAVVATTDFFMPIVDDPFDFGRIAAANALSDIYAMGGRPLFALAIVGMPVGRLAVGTIRAVLAGGAAACEAAGIAVAGGHSIDAPEPIYGLAAIGCIDPAHVKRNDEAEEGDVLILGKPLGVGILSAALKSGDLNAEGYAQLLAVTIQLNRIGTELAEIDGVHAMTDVTGFGLLGHLLELCRGSGLVAALDVDRVPVLPAARLLAVGGLKTGAAIRNWQGYGHQVTLSASLTQWQRNVLCDPQTNGGLLVSCAPDEAARVVRLFRDRGYGAADVIGSMRAAADADVAASCCIVP